jgi:O-antigen/teichoic acid export membrane protein
MAFAGGWQFFAFSTMRDKDQVELTSKVMEYLAALSFLGTFILSLFSDFIFGLFFTGDFILGASVFPYLFLSTLILMLFQTAGNQFTVIKKSYLGLICLLVGAAVNLSFNYFGILFFGIRGAALATLLGYTATLCVAILIARKRNLIKCGPRFLILCAVTAGFIALQFLGVEWVNLYTMVSAVLCVALYSKDALSLVKKVKNRG